MGSWSWVEMRSHVLSEIELMVTYITFGKIKSLSSHSKTHARVNVEYIITCPTCK